MYISLPTTKTFIIVLLHAYTHLDYHQPHPHPYTRHISHCQNNQPVVVVHLLTHISLSLSCLRRPKNQFYTSSLVSPRSKTPQFNRGRGKRRAIGRERFSGSISLALRRNHTVPGRERRVIAADTGKAGQLTVSRELARARFPFSGLSLSFSLSLSLSGLKRSERVCIYTSVYVRGGYCQ